MYVSMPVPVVAVGMHYSSFAEAPLRVNSVTQSVNYQHRMSFVIGALLINSIWIQYLLDSD